MNTEIKLRGRPRIHAIKDENEPKKSRGRQIGFKPLPKPKIEIDSEILKQNKKVICKKSYEKRGKIVQAIKGILVLNNLEPFIYKNVTDDELKQKHTELLHAYKGKKLQNQKKKLETKIYELQDQINSIFFV